MNVLGISPGITRLSYCVLAPGPSVIDTDTLKGPKLGVAAIAALGISELARKFRVHDLILSVVWERYEPTKIVIGPPCPGENSDLVRVAQEALKEMALQCAMQVDDCFTDELLAKKLCTSPRRIKSAIEAMGIPCSNRNRGIVYAMGAALTHFHPGKKSLSEVEELGNFAINSAQGVSFADG